MLGAEASLPTSALFCAAAMAIAATTAALATATASTLAAKLRFCDLDICPSVARRGPAGQCPGNRVEGLMAHVLGIRPDILLVHEYI